jgi:hypothetical protein
VICAAIVVFIQSRHYSLAPLHCRIKRRRIAVAVAVMSSLALLRRRINRRRINRRRRCNGLGLINQSKWHRKNIMVGAVTRH